MIAKVKGKGMNRKIAAILMVGFGLVLAGCDSYETPGSDLQFNVESLSHASPNNPGISFAQKSLSLREDGPGGELPSGRNPIKGKISGVSCNGKGIELETGDVSGGRIATVKYGKFKIVITDAEVPLIGLTKDQKKLLRSDCPPGTK